VEYSLSHFHQVPPVNSASHSDICILVGIELIYRFRVGSSYVWGSLCGQLWAIELSHRPYTFVPPLLDDKAEK